MYSGNAAAKARTCVGRAGQKDKGGGEGGGPDPQGASWHPRPDVIFWQSKPVISGITLYSWPHVLTAIFTHAAVIRAENPCSNGDSLKSCRNICGGYLITNGGFWFLDRRQRESSSNYRLYFSTTWNFRVKNISVLNIIPCFFQSCIITWISYHCYSTKCF